LAWLMEAMDTRVTGAKAESAKEEFALGSTSFHPTYD
jgi:hypothetical protein